ncbi:MAG: glycoside hydrolase family 65 protein, partial [Planctomycetota bacterium]
DPTMTTAHTPEPFLEVHPWRVTETTFDPMRYRTLEGLFALANGYMGQRAGFEEGIGGTDSLRGTYVAGVFDAYPNPTMIRLKGRPDAPAEMVNLPDFLPVEIRIGGAALDLNRCVLESYERSLHLDRGVLTREAVCQTPSGKRLRLATERFLSRPRRHLAATRVTVTPLGWSGKVEFVSRVDGAARNLRHEHLGDHAFLRDEGCGGHGVRCRTQAGGIVIATMALERLEGDGGAWRIEQDEATWRSASLHAVTVTDGQAVTLEKFAAVATSRDADVDGEPPETYARHVLVAAAEAGYAALLAEQEDAWQEAWAGMDIAVEEASGAGALTQGLRYSLYQMAQHDPGGDGTVNIGAKGLTGEHYFGTYFWDTEVFMLPLFALVRPAAAKDLVRFRIRTLSAARAKARELGLNGAAYPFMADADGNESCTLWQFALTGIHVTADVAWGVWFTWLTTGDLDLIAEGGIDVLVETSRFWLDRAHRRPESEELVIQRVLGPDEYHQAVDNNYYTNVMARECLLRTGELFARLAADRPAAAAAARARLEVDDDELAAFADAAGRIRLRRDDARGIRLQDDRFLELEPHDLQAEPLDGALNAVWSYDRILRTQLLRQGDLLVAHLLLEDRFAPGELAADFDFYEPKTTHDSSLSFCHHSILAARLGRERMAYDYFLRTARLDLDDIHGNAWQGVHTACLAGAWQCVVFGFGGVRWTEGRLSVAPLLPAAWTSFRFGLWWRGTRLRVTVRPDAVELARVDGPPCEVRVDGTAIALTDEPVTVARDNTAASS